MLSLNNLNPPAISNDFDRLVALLAFVGDSKACAKRISEIQKSTNEALEVIGKANEIAAERSQQQEAIKAERAEHEKQIADDRAAFAKECAQREQVISNREGELAKMLAEAQAARDEAAKITEDLRLRLERVRAAAA
jgi:hypothetical protein